MEGEEISSKKPTDEELIDMARRGDHEAENQILSRYKELVMKISRGYYLVGGDLEDLIQEGMIGLYNAVKNFSLTGGASFKTYAVVCIKHQIHSAIRKSQSNKNQPLSSAVSFNNFASSESLDFLPMELIFDNTPAQLAIDQENFENLQKMINSTLSPKEILVLSQWLDGFSYKEIAKNLGINDKSIDNTLTQIKHKLKTKLNIKKSYSKK